MYEMQLEIFDFPLEISTNKIISLEIIKNVWMITLRYEKINFKINDSLWNSTYVLNKILKNGKITKLNKFISYQKKVKFTYI